LALLLLVKRIKGEKNEEDPIIKILTRRKENLEKARSIMMDEDNLGFVFVMNAERLPIEETKKAVKLLDDYKIPVEYLIINRILPESSDSFWQEKKRAESAYLREIEEDFSVDKIYKIPLYQQDMHAVTIDLMSKCFDSTQR
jgi:arsenite-transporting ATPase